MGRTHSQTPLGLFVWHLSLFTEATQYTELLYAVHWSTKRPRLQQQHLGRETLATHSPPSLHPQLGTAKLEETCGSKRAQAINDDKTLMSPGSLWSKYPGGRHMKGRQREERNRGINCANYHETKTMTWTTKKTFLILFSLLNRRECELIIWLSRNDSSEMVASRMVSMSRLHCFSVLTWVGKLAHKVI